MTQTNDKGARKDMVTLNDIKYEHKHALQIVETLSARLSDNNLSNSERDEIIEDLHKWNIIQKYALNKYKEHKDFE